MSHWKTKATVQSLIGKGTLTFKCGSQSPKIQFIVTEVVALYPPAWNYDELVGKIWMPEPQGYDTRSGGTVPIEVRDPSGTGALGEIQGGYYDNR